MQRLWPRERVWLLPLKEGNTAPVLGADPAKNCQGKGGGITESLPGAGGTMDAALMRWEWSREGSLLLDWQQLHAASTSP